MLKQSKCSDYKPLMIFMLVALAWRSVKACHEIINVFTLFQHFQFYCKMDTNKDSNLFSYLRTKYGEDCVRLLRKWEITIEKMADYRNHRRFTLKCIKASITPVSCKVKNPLKTRKVMTSFIKQINNSYMKGSETSIAF